MASGEEKRRARAVRDKIPLIVEVRNRPRSYYATCPVCKKRGLLNPVYRTVKHAAHMRETTYCKIPGGAK